ncbi:MAG: transketolase [bacterium]|nr:transketolase [bacterium]
MEKKAAQIRLDTLTALYDASKGNVGSLMSVVEILVNLYYKEMRIDPAKPGWDGQDYMILSKSDSVLVQYAILADLGFFDKSELSYYGKSGALLKTCPDIKVPGIFATLSGGGQGLSVATGLALSLKTARKNNRVFTLVGDYELMKGQIWEAALCAAHYKLDNLVMFIDDPILDIESGVKVDKIQDKFEAFGWSVIQVLNGHDFEEISNAIHKSSAISRKPICIWCNTIAGKGIEFAERKASYLNASLSDGEMSYVIPKLEQLV